MSQVYLWEEILGGPMGDRARERGIWFRPAPWVLAFGTLNFMILMYRQLPCVADPGAQYRAMCYTDITPLFYARGLNVGQIPFVTTDVEYPVLTGVLMHATRLLVNLFGGVTSPSASAAEQLHASHLFFAISAFSMFVFFLVLLVAHLRLSRPWDAVMIALAPAVLTCGLVNWEMLVLACTALAWLAWSKKRPVWAGVWIGLGVAAKLYPLLLLVPIGVLCLRSGKLRIFFLTTCSAVGSWLAVNLPVFLISPSGWTNFWMFNADRGADWGSIWLMLERWGIKVEGVSAWVAILMVLGTLAICALALGAPRRPRLAQIAILVLVLFLVVNKVYSPQYVLWLLPFLVLARPSWSLWGVFGVTEFFYYWAIWGELGQSLTDGMAHVYGVAILVRVLGQLLIAGLVVRDVLVPQADLVRVDGADDPDGGYFDGAEDVFRLARQAVA